MTTLTHLPTTEKIMMKGLKKSPFYYDDHDDTEKRKYQFHQVSRKW